MGYRNYYDEEYEYDNGGYRSEESNKSEESRDDDDRVQKKNVKPKKTLQQKLSEIAELIEEYSKLEHKFNYVSTFDVYRRGNVYENFQPAYSTKYFNYYYIDDYDEYLLKNFVEDLLLIDNTINKGYVVRNLRGKFRFLVV